MLSLEGKVSGGGRRGEESSEKEPGRPECFEVCFGGWRKNNNINLLLVRRLVHLSRSCCTTTIIV